MRRSTINRRFTVKNFCKAEYGKRKTSNSNSVIFYKNERRDKMKKLNKIEILKKEISILILFIVAALNVAFTGCGDSNISGSQQTESGNTAAGNNTKPPLKDSTIIKLDLNISFKSEFISESKLLESNNGNKFNNIVSFSKVLNPRGELDLQELQQSGIFGLYISSEGSFTLSNSDGLSFSTKTVLMEKCSFIDLKIRNNEQSPIKVIGFVAGE